MRPTAVPLASMPPAPDLMAAMMPRAGAGGQKRDSEAAQARTSSPQPEPRPSRAEQPREQPGSSADPGIRVQTDDQRQVIAALEKRDRQVRDHENAHRAAGGDLVRGGSYDYQQGPDGRRHAIGGDVKIDTAPSPGKPEATAEKMAQVVRAALAPARPSTTDLAVAAQATAELNRARAESQADSVDAMNSSESTQATTDDRQTRSAATAYRATAEQSDEAQGNLRLEA